MVRVDHGALVAVTVLVGHEQCRIHHVAGRTSTRGPAHRRAREQVQHHAAVELAVSRGMFGDVGEPQFVGAFGDEVSLDEVLAGGDVDQVRPALARTGQTLYSQAFHELLHEFGVDDETVFDLEGGLDAQDAIGAAAAPVDLVDEVAQHDLTYLAVTRWTVAHLVVGRAI